MNETFQILGRRLSHSTRRCLRQIFGNIMRPLVVPVVLLLVGCSAAGPKHLSAKKFESSFEHSQQVAMQHFFYAAETNGCIYVSRITWANWWYYSKMRWQTIYTETNGLRADFLQYVRQHPFEQRRSGTNWVGKPKTGTNSVVNQSEPFRLQTNSTSAAGSSP